MRRLDYDELRDIIADQPHTLLLATVSGAHLYGFPSRDSDIDLRGAHVLPAEEVVEAPGYLGELMAAKAEAEHGPLTGPSGDRLEQDVTTLQAVLDQAEIDSKLADRPTADAALHDLLVRTRLRSP
jgi:hypothetical protein